MLSHKARLEELERLLQEKEAAQKKLAAEEKKAKDDIERAKRELTQELEELRREDEVGELRERIAELERQGRSDEVILEELRRRGVEPDQVRRALEEHLESHPEHDHEHTLEEIAAEARPRPQERPQTVYDVAEQMRAAQSFYDLASQDMYRRLQSLEESVQSRGLTPNEYERLNEMQSELRERQEGYSDQHSYAQRESALIDRIKKTAGIGESAYERGFGQRDERF